MLPIGAFKTKEQKEQIAKNRNKAVRKANRLGQFKMLRNNVCDECGHYMTTHDENGCRCSTWDNEKQTTKKCPCERKNELQEKS